MNDETISNLASMGDRARDAGAGLGVFGKITMPVIDLLFFWQGPNHCFNAYRKEHDRQNLPNEYRREQPGFFTSGRGD